MARRVLRPLSYFFAACAVAALGTWGAVLTTLCSNPRTPIIETQHVVPYTCHGMTVFISQNEETLTHWLIPLFILLALCAAVLFALSAVTVRITVTVRREEGSTGDPPHEGSAGR